MSCDQCLKAQFEADDVRDCGVCLKPTMFPENIVPYQMYQLVNSQWIVAGMGEPLALNYATVLSVLGLYIDDKEDLIDVFEKIVYLSQLDLKAMREKTKK